MKYEFFKVATFFGLIWLIDGDMSVSINCVYKIYDHMHVAFPRIIP